MNHPRFDELVKHASRAAETRRGALRMTVAGVASILAGSGFRATASAKKKKKRCKRSNNTCNLNRPGTCCSAQCCYDATSDTDGTCSNREATCCTERALGGYCPREFPLCCGSDRCCAAGQVCCLLTGGRGACCDPLLGQVCVQGAGCVQEEVAALEAASAAGPGANGVARQRAGT